MIATAGDLGVEFANEFERRVRVVDVVVGEFLALQLIGASRRRCGSQSET